MLTRRTLVAADGLALAGIGRAGQRAPAAVPPSVDHVILGVRDLQEGIDWVAQRVGLRAALGGVHPGRGTRNALLALGSRRYLEIMAPDPAQPASADARELRALADPTVPGWASHLADMAGVTTRLRMAGIAFEGPKGVTSRCPKKCSQEQNVVLRFTPKPAQSMLIACLYSHWIDPKSPTFGALLLSPMSRRRMYRRRVMIDASSICRHSTLMPGSRPNHGVGRNCRKFSQRAQCPYTRTRRYRQLEQKSVHFAAMEQPKSFRRGARSYIQSLL